VAQSDDEELTGAILIGTADTLAAIRRDLGGKAFSRGGNKIPGKAKSSYEQSL
jgi:hypothetical protein